MYQHYPPRVRSGSKEQLIEVVALNNESHSLEEADGLSQRKNQEEASSGDFYGGSKRKARGPATSWKKRARQGMFSPEKPVMVGNPEGKRKVEKMAEERPLMKPN